MSDSRIFVSRPSLPPLEDLIPFLEQIWDNKILTNGGPFHSQFEDALCEYLGVQYISLFSSGTTALITALKALDIQGEVITTPYSFVATAHSLLWNDIRPVFVDIDPVTLNLDPKQIEAAINPCTTAIMPVHVYGHPCDVKAIDAIGKKYNLKVIYDAAHAFGVKLRSGSVLNHGDLSVLSFHATKVFNTFEGGAIVSQNSDIKCCIDQLKNFGFTGETTVEQIGINGKMNEFSAALGLLQLQHVDVAIGKRKAIDAAYRERLRNISGIHCHIRLEGESNYGYFPIFVEDDYPLTRDQLYNIFKANNVNVRRYFFPLIKDFSMYRKILINQVDELQVAEIAASKVICLPIYETLSDQDIEKIVGCISDS